jgi:uncharacterized oligopeptide transporter (OPT) family protein
VAVQQSKYREPPTPGGLESMEKGTLEWFDIDMYGNLNTGVLEQYLEEKNRRQSFGVSKWAWSKILIAITIGSVFAVISEYVSLKIGMGISAGYYIIYLLGLALRWKPSEINVASAATDATASVAMGFIFSFPAIYLLKYSADYAVGRGSDGGLVFLVTTIPPIWLAILASILAGWLGTVYFVLFRRLWLVDDPLHVPGFEPSLKLMEIANDIERGGVEGAKRSIRIVGLWSVGTAIFTFFRDVPLINKQSLMDRFFGGAFYKAGEIRQSQVSAHFTYLSFTILPIQIGVGWFMRFRVALLMCLGTFLTWFIIVPLAVWQHVPVYDVGVGGFVDVSTYYFASWMAYRKIAVIIGIGALLGGGFFALFKMAPTFKGLIRDVTNAFRGSGEDASKASYIVGKGYYDWPISHIVVVALLSFGSILGVLLLAGFPFLEALVFCIVLLMATFIFAAITVKTMGETGNTPISATSILVLLIMILVFKFILHSPNEVAVIISLIGTTIFCSAISLGALVTIDFKIGLYIGNRPYHIMKSMLSAIIPGAVVAALAAGFLSFQLATGKLDLIAPQARVFATLTQIIFAGQSNEVVLEYIVMGIAIGIFMEIMTGMGTAFGLGMYFPLSIQLPLLLGGALRDLYQKLILEPRAKAERWNERKRTLAILDTYMAASGLTIGEPVVAMIAALIMVTMG